MLALLRLRWWAEASFDNTPLEEEGSPVPTDLESSEWGEGNGGEGDEL